MTWLRDWYTLLRLAGRRFRSDADYLKFQTYQGILLIEFLQKQGVTLEGRVLDLGCGNGGYSEAMNDSGAYVVSLDLRQLVAPPPVFVCGSALELPFGNDRFRFVFCASVIEHVPQPRLLLEEIERILTPGGSAYISLPPFYSPVGGHQFKPFHLLGERIAVRLSGSGCTGFAKGCSSGGFNPLYPLTIRQVRNLVREVGLEITSITTRFFPVNMARIPLLGEFLTWHVQFVVRKPHCRSRSRDLAWPE